jgi:hypothetical protein
MRTGGTRRKALTRIDVLVLVVVIFTAVGLILAALAGAHAPAQRVECAKHFQEMGAAVQHFSDFEKSLPASCIAPGYATWPVEIAPYLASDRGRPLAQWQAALTYGDQPAAVREAQIWLFLCPARRRPPQLSQSGDIPLVGGGKGEHFPGALGDYGCAPTSNQATMAWDSPSADGALVVGQVIEKKDGRIVSWRSRVTLDALQRGQSFTILLGEKHVRQGDFGMAERGDGSIYNGDYPASFARLTGDDYPLAQSPTDTYRSNFGSWHVGVCQFLMADGSLRAFANDVDPDVLQRLIPRQLPEVKE